MAMNETVYKGTGRATWKDGKKFRGSLGSWLEMLPHRVAAVAYAYFFFDVTPCLPYVSIFNMLFLKFQLKHKLA